jgi:hypothetical protein
MQKNAQQTKTDNKWIKGQSECGEQRQKGTNLATSPTTHRMRDRLLRRSCIDMPATVYSVRLHYPEWPWIDKARHGGRP